MAVVAWIGTLAGVLAVLATPNPGIAGVAMAQDAAVDSVPAFIVDPADCQRLRQVMTEHHPDVDVTYQPGVDVHGKPVVGADIDDYSALAEAAAPKVLSFDITIDALAWAKSFGATYPAGLEAKHAIGTIAYDREAGTFTLDGQPLGPAQQTRLLEDCRLLDEMNRAAAAPKPPQ